MGSGNNPFRPAANSSNASNAGNSDKHKNRATLDGGNLNTPQTTAPASPATPATTPTANSTLGDALASLNTEPGVVTGGGSAFDPLNVPDPVNTPLDFNNASAPQGTIAPLNDTAVPTDANSDQPANPKLERKKRFGLLRKKKAAANTVADPLHNNLMGFDPLDPISLDAPGHSGGLLADATAVNQPTSQAGNQLLNELGNSNATAAPVEAAATTPGDTTPAIELTDPALNINATTFPTDQPTDLVATAANTDTPATDALATTGSSSTASTEAPTRQFTISIMTIVATLLFLVSAAGAIYLYIKNNQLSQDNLALNQENQSLKASNNNNSTANNKSSNQFNVLQDKIKELTDTNTENKKTLDDNKKQIEDLTKQNDDLTKKLNEAQAKILSDKTTSDSIKEFMSALCVSTDNHNISDTTYCVEHKNNNNNNNNNQNNNGQH